MNAFIRQLAALAALWALCEMLLGESRQRHMVHMTVSLMVMAVLLRALTAAMGAMPPAQPSALLLQPAGEVVTGYDRIALSSMANQLRTLCCGMIRRAGYDGDAAVSLSGDGALEEVVLYLTPREPSAVGEKQLAESVGKLLGVPAGQVRWQRMEGTGQ